MCLSTLPQEGAKLFVLCRGEATGGTIGNGGLKATIALQACFPGVNRVDRHAEVVGDLLVSVGATLDPFEGG